MKNYKKVFHYISYLQYPLMVIAIFWIYKPIFFDFSFFWSDVNKGLVFMGLAIGFSTLQDTTKTQNKLSKWVYENPKYARIFLLVLAFQIVLFITFGLFGFLYSDNEPIQEVAFGVLVLGIGMIGMLKAAMEMADYHAPKKDDHIIDL